LLSAVSVNKSLAIFTFSIISRREFYDALIKGEKREQKNGIYESLYRYYSIVYEEKVLPYNCRCGGKLVEAMINVEHLGIDFGLRKGAVCTFGDPCV